MLCNKVARVYLKSSNFPRAKIASENLENRKHDVLTGKLPPLFGVSGRTFRELFIRKRINN